MSAEVIHRQDTQDCLAFRWRILYSVLAALMVGTAFIVILSLVPVQGDAWLFPLVCAWFVAWSVWWAYFVARRPSHA